MKMLSNTETEMKKSVAYKKKRVSICDIAFAHGFKETPMNLFDLLLCFCVLRLQRHDFYSKSSMLNLNIFFVCKFVEKTW